MLRADEFNRLLYNCRAAPEKFDFALTLCYKDFPKVKMETYDNWLNNILESIAARKQSLGKKDIKKYKLVAEGTYVGFGIAIGPAIGVAIGSAMEAKAKKDGKII